jgi:hypothetical protein
MGAFNWEIFLWILIPSVIVACVGISSGGLVIGLIGLIAGLVVATRKKSRKVSLEGFQSQDSTAFQLAVRAALEEAIDLAGISKALIQELPTEKSKERRVI